MRLHTLFIEVNSFVKVSAGDSKIYNSFCGGDLWDKARWKHKPAVDPSVVAKFCCLWTPECVLLSFDDDSTKLDSLDGHIECRHHFVLLDSIWEGKCTMIVRLQSTCRKCIQQRFNQLFSFFFAFQTFNSCLVLYLRILFYRENFPHCRNADINCCGFQTNCIDHNIRIAMEKYWTRLDGRIIDFSCSWVQWKEKVPSRG